MDTHVAVQGENINEDGVLHAVGMHPCRASFQFGNKIFHRDTQHSS